MVIILSMPIVLRRGDVAFFVMFAFLCGVFMANEGWNLFFIFGTMCVGFLGIFYFGKYRYLWRRTLLLCAAIFLGTFYYFFTNRWIVAHTHIPMGKKVEFFGFVNTEPKHAGNFMMLNVNLSKPYSGTVDIFASPKSQFHYGDIIWARGKIESSTDPSEAPAAFLPQLSVLTSHNGFFIKEWAIAARSFVAARFTPLFASDKAALLAGIVTGSTDAISKDIKSQMDVSGTSYIVGMYGYKIAILAAFIVALLKDIISRKALLFSILATIWSFIFISGAGVSAVRAGIMGSLALVASAMGRMFVARTAITLTALIMVLLDPRALSEAGFQLSFLSFLGIYYLGDSIKHFFHWTNRGFLEWKEHAMLALTTNLAIIPVVMNTFGGFSLTSFISNILIMLPWVLIIFCGIFVAAVQSIFPILAFFPIQLLNILLSYELFIIKFFSVAVIPIPNIFISQVAIIAYYGILLIFIHHYDETS